MKTVAIFASGNGSNFEAIVKYFTDKDISFVLITDIETAYVRERAKSLSINDIYVKFEDTYNFLLKNKFDLYVLAGYMRILPKHVLELGSFVNIHPSYLPEFKGKNAIQRAYDSNSCYSGVTIHYVSEEVDSGEVIFKIKIPILSGMTLQNLESRVHGVENYIYPRVINNILFNSAIDIEKQVITL